MKHTVAEHIQFRIKTENITFREAKVISEKNCVSHGAEFKEPQTYSYSFRDGSFIIFNNDEITVEVK